MAVIFLDGENHRSVPVTNFIT